MEKKYARIAEVLQKKVGDRSVLLVADIATVQTSHEPEDVKTAKRVATIMKFLGDVMDYATAADATAAFANEDAANA